MLHIKFVCVRNKDNYSEAVTGILIFGTHKCTVGTTRRDRETQVFCLTEFFVAKIM
jgi:hypothetical protein